MSTISDKEIKQLFQAANEPVADNGFTKRVMKQIPKKNRDPKPIIVWGFGIIGFIIALFSGALLKVIGSVAIFGRELSQAKVPELSISLVYVIVLLSMIGFTASFFRKGWS